MRYKRGEYSSKSSGEDTEDRGLSSIRLSSDVLGKVNLK